MLQSWSSSRDAVEGSVVDPRALVFAPITDITSTTPPPHYEDIEENYVLYRSQALCPSLGGFLEAPSAVLRSYSEHAILDQEIAYRDLPSLYLENQPPEIIGIDTEGMADTQYKDEMDTTAESDADATFRSL